MEEFLGVHSWISTGVGSWEGFHGALPPPYDHSQNPCESRERAQQIVHSRHCQFPSVWVVTFVPF